MLLYETRLQEQSARGSCPVCHSSLSPDSGIINETALQALYKPQADKGKYATNETNVIRIDRQGGSQERNEGSSDTGMDQTRWIPCMCAPRLRIIVYAVAWYCML